MLRLHRIVGLQAGVPHLIGSLIILNGPSLSSDLLDLVWPISKGKLRCPVVCADGGANLLYDMHKHSTSASTALSDSAGPKKIPTHIVGDLDSVRPDVQTWYEGLGTKIVKMPSVDSNDFQKALEVAHELREEKELPTVVIGGHGGRMDQTLGNLNVLYCCAEAQEDVYWLEKSNAVLVLSPGKHHILIDPWLEGKICGIVPVGKPVQSISTEGLKWNLDCQTLAFGTGGLISTSNEVVEQTIVIDTSDPVLWTIELRI